MPNIVLAASGALARSSSTPSSEVSTGMRCAGSERRSSRSSTLTSIRPTFLLMRLTRTIRALRTGLRPLKLATTTMRPACLSLVTPTSVSMLTEARRRLSWSICDNLVLAMSKVLWRLSGMTCQSLRNSAAFSTITSNTSIMGVWSGLMLAVRSLTYICYMFTFLFTSLVTRSRARAFKDGVQIQNSIATTIYLSIS